VIAVIIVVAVFVGYHASQPTDEVEEHDISMELEILNKNTESVQILQKPEMSIQIS
jgi:hypothetical protein